MKNFKFWDAPLAQGHAHFLFWVYFMMGLGKPKRHTKFEVASKNIKGGLQIFWELPKPRATPTFLLRGIL